MLPVLGDAVAMRRLALLGFLLSGLAVAGGVGLDQSLAFTFTDCAVGGSSAQTVTGGQYLFMVTDSDVWVCLADSGATCAAGGTRFPVGTVMLMSFGAGGKSVACRSAASNGDVSFTRAN